MIQLVLHASLLKTPTSGLFPRPRKDCVQYYSIDYRYIVFTQLIIFSRTFLDRCKKSLCGYLLGDVRRWNIAASRTSLQIVHNNVIGSIMGMIPSYLRTAFGNLNLEISHVSVGEPSSTRKYGLQTKWYFVSTFPTHFSVFQKPAKKAQHFFRRYSPLHVHSTKSQKTNHLPNMARPTATEDPDNSAGIEELSRLLLQGWTMRKFAMILPLCPLPRHRRVYFQPT